MTPEAQLALIAILPATIAAIMSAFGLWVTMQNNQHIADVKAAQDHSNAVLAETKTTVVETKDQLMQTDARVLDLGIKTDGKLTQLLDTSIANANAAGRVEGTAIERDRIAVETAAKNAAVAAQIQGTINGGAEPPVAIPGGPDPKVLNTEELT